MTVRRWGEQTPTNRSDFESEADLSEYAELSGMEYAIYAHRDPEEQATLIETDHDAVGLVTYWFADTFEEAETWVYKWAAHADEQAAQQSYSQLVAAAFSVKEELAGALLAGLAAIGDIGDWDSETIEVLLDPVVKVLQSVGIPSVGSAGDDDRAFWRGVAIATGNQRS